MLWYVKRLSPALLAMALSCVACAGQIPSHIYTALQSKAFLSGSARQAVDANLDAYLSGAQGPDICGVVMPALNTISWFRAAGKETHYDPRKAMLALNLLDAARTDRERAYALGWISHYINDMFIHELVNNYGGYYELYEARHALLEQLENKHVLASHPEVLTALSRPIPETPETGFAGFIFDAYQRTWPENPIYQSGNEWIADNRPYFCSRYNEAADWCGKAAVRFAASHRDGTGRHGWGIATLKFPNMPSDSEYKQLRQAVQITTIQPSDGSLAVSVRVQDNRLFGRFTADWDAAAQAAVQYANQVFTLASRYLAETDPGRKAALRKELYAVIPNVNLDQPKAVFDPNRVTPGDISMDRLTYVLTVNPAAPKGKPAPKPVTLSGTSPKMTLTSRHFGGTQAGAVSWSVPLPAGVRSGHYTLTVSLSGKDAWKTPAYRTVDWTSALGAFGADKPQSKPPAATHTLLSMRTYHANKQLYQEYTYYKTAGGQAVKQGRYREWNAKGVLTDEMTFIDGKLEGVWKHWWPTGELYFEETYVHGAANGPYKRYFKNGQLDWEGVKRDGNYIGVWTRYHENGRKRSEQDWGDGGAKPVREQEWDESGKELRILYH